MSREFLMLFTTHKTYDQVRRIGSIWHGEVEQPVNPMVRLGKPLYDDAGHLHGAPVIDYQGGKLFISASMAGQTMLLNSDGYWLSSPNPEDEWFMFKARKSRAFGCDFSEIWQRIFSRPYKNVTPTWNSFSTSGIWRLSIKNRMT